MKLKHGRQELTKKVKKGTKESIPQEVSDMDEEMEEDALFAEEVASNVKRVPKSKIPTKKTITNAKKNDDEDDDEEEIISSKKHKEKLMKLKETDPEFFKFMQEEDADLLDFEESDAEDVGEEDEENDDDSDEDEDDEQSKKRVPKAKKDGSGRLVFDGNLYDHLENLLDPRDSEHQEESKRLDAEDITFAVEAFQACVARVGADIESPKYVINEQQIFEDVVRLCFRFLGDILKKLGLGSQEVGHKKNKHFKRCQGSIKTYLSGVLLFLNEVQSEAVIVSTLKTIQNIIDLYGRLTKIARNLIKVLVRIWTRKTLQCRLMAYVCMNQLLKAYPEFLSTVYKSAYLGFVSNAREVTAETWPLLQFMHRTFAELTLVVPDSAYPYAFVYIRQTAIHLRNAILSKKRSDLIQTIYNWQLMQCLYLWVRVVSKAHSVNGAESICELSYPLTQIIIGVSQLYKAPRFLPLRYHCISLLIQLQASCITYIPVLSLASELFEDLVNLLRNKPKPSSIASKEIDLECVLKVHAESRESPTFRTAACEQLFKLMLQAAHSMCGQPAFPDICQPVLHRISGFLKNGKNIGDHGRLFRGLTEKLKEHSNFVSNIMLQRDIALHDEMNVRAAKLALNNPNSPLRLYYQQWEKAWKMRQDLALKVDTVSKSENNTKKPLKVIKQAKKNESMDKPLKKKKKVSTPAAKRADAGVPDTVADLDEWSD